MHKEKTHAHALPPLWPAEKNSFQPLFFIFFLYFPSFALFLALVTFG